MKACLIKISLLVCMLAHAPIHANNESALPSHQTPPEQTKNNQNNSNEIQEQNKKRDLYQNHSLDHTNELAFKVYIIARTALLVGSCALASWALFDLARAFVQLNYYGLEED